MPDLIREILHQVNRLREATDKKNKNIHFGTGELLYQKLCTDNVRLEKKTPENNLENDDILWTSFREDRQSPQ